MTDKEWDDYVNWWKSKWSSSTPNRESVEQYLKYLEGNKVIEKGG